MGYTKLFSSILASSVWQEKLPTKIVWITMLALKNDRHIVEASLVGLAHIAGVSEKEARVAVEKFEKEDPDSRNPENGGKKIERVNGGWLILNGEFYKKLLSQDERREYQRVKQAEYRAKRKRTKTEVEVNGSNGSEVQRDQFNDGKSMENPTWKGG